MRWVKSTQSGKSKTGAATLLLGRIARVFRFADGADAFDVEFLVVGVARDRVDLESLHHQNAHADVRLFVSRQPDFVVDVSLLENEARSLLKIRDKAAGEPEIANEVRFQTRHVVRFFIDPDYPRKFVRDFLDEFVRFEFGVGLKVEDEDVLLAMVRSLRETSAISSGRDEKAPPSTAFRELSV